MKKIILIILLSSNICYAQAIREVKSGEPINSSTVNRLIEYVNLKSASTTKDGLEGDWNCKSMTLDNIENDAQTVSSGWVQDSDNMINYLENNIEFKNDGGYKAISTKNIFNSHVDNDALLATGAIYNVINNTIIIKTGNFRYNFLITFFNDFDILLTNMTASASWDSRTITCSKYNTIPRTPTNLSYTQDGNGNIVLSWVDNATDEIGYHVYKKDSKVDNSYKLIDTVSENIITSITILNPGIFWYEVKAYNDKGESKESNTIYIEVE